MREHRVTWTAAERIAEGLSERDQAIADTVRRVRVVTGRQVERLHFAELRVRTVTARDAVCWPVSLIFRCSPRWIGALEVRGRAVPVWSLRSVSSGNGSPPSCPIVTARHRNEYAAPARRPTRFLKHSLAVSELYVQLVELARHQKFTLATFRAEPACWWQDSTGNWIKPDAYVCLETTDLTDSWAIEVDQATESPSTLRRKLSVYLQLVERGEDGPDGDALPRVLITVPDEERRAVVHALIQELPDPAMQLFTVVLHANAARFMIEVLRE